MKTRHIVLLLALLLPLGMQGQTIEYEGGRIERGPHRR